jgi:hypothetical protein
VDANKQALAYVYGHADPLDEARRVAANIAKLPHLLGKGDLRIGLGRRATSILRRGRIKKPGR